MMIATKNPILIDLPLPITTPRLLLRPVMPGDGAALHEAKEETWDMLTQWMPWTRDGLGTAESAELYARQAYARFILREDIGIVGLEHETGRPVIWTGLHRFNWNVGHFEIGYWVRRSAQGCGYASESSNALTRFAFGALGARRVLISHALGNAASRRVIQKLGFEREAYLKQACLLPDGAVTDHVHYIRFTANGLPPLDVKWGPP